MTFLHRRKERVMGTITRSFAVYVPLDHLAGASGRQRHCQRKEQKQ
jgi:hypothetical protein